MTFGGGFAGGLIVGQIVTRIVADASQYMRAMDKSEQRARAWQTAVGGALSAIGASASAYITKATLTAARTQVLGTSLRTVGEAAGYSQAEIKHYEESVKSMGITTQEARLALVRFIQSNLDLEKAAKLARAAQDLAVIAGQNSSQAFATITQAIAAQRPILLRQYGIVKDLTDIYKDFGREIGIYTETVNSAGEVQGHWVRDLTETEKKQAFLNVILREAAKVSGVYASAMEDAGKKLTSLPRVFQEAENAIGEQFLPVFNRAVTAVYEGFKWFDKQSDAVKKTAATFLGLTAAVGALGGAALIAGPAIVMMGGAIASVAAPVAAVVAGVMALSAAWNFNFLGMREKTHALLKATRGLAQYMKREWGPAMSGVVEEWRRTFDWARAQVSAGLSKIGIDSQLLHKIWSFAMKGLSDTAYQMLNAVTYVVKGMTGALSAMARAARGDFKGALDEVKQTMRELSDVSVESTRQTVAAVMDDIKAVDDLARSDEKLVRLAHAWKRLGDEAEQSVEKTAAAGVDMADVWDRITEQVKESLGQRENAVRDTLARIRDEYAQSAVNIVDLEYQRTDALERLQREYLDLRERLQEKGDERGLRELERANKKRRDAILRYYSLRIEDEKRKQNALLTMAKTYLTVAKANLSAAMAEQVATTKFSMDTILSITRHAWGGVTTISRAAQEAMKGAWDPVRIKQMMDEIDAMFADIENQAKQASENAAREFEAWREANEGLGDSLEDVGVDLDKTKKRTEKLRDPLEAAASTTEKIARMVNFVRDSLEELAAFGGPRGDWLTPLRDVMDSAVTLVDEWTKRVSEIVAEHGDMLTGDGADTFNGVLAAVRNGAGAVGSVVAALDKLETVDTAVPMGTLEAVVEWGRAFIEGMADLQDLGETAADKKILAVMSGLKTAAGAIGSVVGAVDKLGGLDVSEAAVADALDYVEEMSAVLVDKMRSISDKVGRISGRTTKFAGQLKTLVAPIEAIAGLVDRLNAIRWLRNSDIGGLVGWSIEILAQIAVRMEELRRRLPSRYIPKTTLTRFAAALGDLMKPLAAVAEFLSGFGGIRYMQNTGLGRVVGWSVEILAQSAVYLEELRRRLPDRYIPNATLRKFAENIKALLDPIKAVADVVEAMGRIRFAGTGVGQLVGRSVAILGQAAVYIAQLKDRLPDAYLPDEETRKFADGIKALVEPIAALGDIGNALVVAERGRGRNIGATIGWLTSVLGQIVVHMGDLRRKLPRVYRMTPETREFANALNALVAPVQAGIDVIGKLDTVRYARGTNAGRVVGWVVDILEQIIVRTRRLRRFNTTALRETAETIEAMSPILDAFQSTIELVQGLAVVGGLRGRINAGAQITFIVDIIRDIGQKVRLIRSGARQNIIRFRDTALALGDVVNALASTADMLTRAGAVRNMDQAQTNVEKMLDVWNNILITLDSRIKSSQLTLTPTLQKWGESVTALASGLEAGIRVLRESRIIGDVQSLIPLATDIGTALVEFSNAMAREIAKYSDSNNDIVSKWGESVQALMGGLSAGIETLRNLPKTWRDPGTVWDHFKEWTQGAYDDFYTWVNDPNNGLAGEGMDLTAKFADGLNSLMGGLRSALELASSLPLTWDVPADVWDAFKGWVKDTFSDFDAWANQISSDPQYFEPVAAFGSAMQAVFGGLGEALKVFEGLVGYIPPTQENVDKFTQAVKDAFADFRDEAEKIGDDGISTTAEFGNSLQSLTSGLNSALDLFTKLMNEQTLEFIGTGSEKDGRLNKALSDLVQGISTTMSAFQTWVLDKYSSTWGPAADLFRAKVDAVIGTMRAALDLFTSLQEHGLPSTSLIQQFIDQTINLFKTFAQEVGGTGDEIGGEKDNISAALSDMVTTVNSYQDDFEAAGRGLARALAETTVTEANMEWRGVAMMLGLKRGLENKRSDVVTAIRATAETMRAELEKAWGIASPSRVAMGIGEQISAGLIQGLGDTSAIFNQNKLDVNARKEIYVRVNVSGESLTPEQRWELARELSYLVRAGA